MIGVLLDTDVIIECLRNNKKVIDEVLNINMTGTPLYYSPITKCEIYCGVREDETDIVKNLFDQLESLPVTDMIGEKAGIYQNTYRKNYNLELGDALIAATAYNHQLLLYTFNRKHYPMGDIKLYN